MRRLDSGLLGEQLKMSVHTVPLGGRRFSAGGWALISAGGLFSVLFLLPILLIYMVINFRYLQTKLIDEVNQIMQQGNIQIFYFSVTWT
jgi:hypothetical protein